jgi:hypothetical protein
MTAVRLAGLRAPGWSVAALGLCLVAEAVTLAVIFGPGQDPGSVVWPLVVLPLAAAALPVAVPRRSARISGAVVLGGWCVVASASAGLFFAPSLVAMICAAGREGSEHA